MPLIEELRTGVFTAADTPGLRSTKPAVPAATPQAAPRRRGRPLEMSPDALLAKIRDLAQREEGLFKIHRTHSALYARARRLFGSWAEAVRAAGINYDATIDRARTRSIRARRKRGETV